MIGSDFELSSQQHATAAVPPAARLFLWRHFASIGGIGREVSADGDMRFAEQPRPRELDRGRRRMFAANSRPKITIRLQVALW
jgi:hypothetical protein